MLEWPVGQVNGRMARQDCQMPGRPDGQMGGNLGWADARAASRRDEVYVDRHGRAAGCKGG